MKRQKPLILFLLALCFLFFGVFGVKAAIDDNNQPQLRELQQITRQIIRPAPEHPGNVFLADEQVTIELPRSLPAQTVRWQVLDDRGNVLERSALDRDSQTVQDIIKIGKVDIGWYRIEFLDADGKVLDWTTAAVLAPQAEPVPQDSPVCVDSATSWFAPNDPARQERFAQLAALAGANWIRDRIKWAGAQTGPDRFAENTTYDSAAALQARYGLKVLQVFHDTPGWAVDKQLDGEHPSGRFPRDLRVLYKFCETMARRYQGKVLAWEPWNEANITVFGGHTIDEMCSHQKAAYLGFKAGNPSVTVCWNVYAGSGTALHTDGVLENEAWPYFETFNIHTYSDPDSYLTEFAPARQAACGRPIWLTECGILLKWKTGQPWCELSPEDELRQAQFIARSYAGSFFAGVSRHFFFILGNYPENEKQFGILRNDQTPRPGYVALAAVGRLLAGAGCLGRWLPKENPALRVYAFCANPDGRQKDVLVAWGQDHTNFVLPENLSVEVIYDYLGRPIGKTLPKGLDSSAVFIVLAKGDAEKLSLEQSPEPSSFRQGGPSPIVLQLQMPQSSTNLDIQAHRVPSEQETNLNIFVYNFGNTKVSGTVSIERSPTGWQMTPQQWEVTLEPMERKALSISVTIPADVDGAAKGDWIKLRGKFGSSGQPALAFRLAASSKI
jgi:hypothetical protein